MYVRGRFEGTDVKSEDGRWTKDADGNDIPPPKIAEYAEWVLSWPHDGDMPKTDTAYAEENGVSRRSLVRWKSDPRFQFYLEAQGHKITNSYDTAYRIFKAMERKAIEKGSVQAAQLCLDIMGRYRPTERTVRHEHVLGEMSDEQLRRIVARADDEVQALEAVSTERLD